MKGVIVLLAVVLLGVASVVGQPERRSASCEQRLRYPTAQGAGSWAELRCGSGKDASVIYEAKTYQWTITGCNVDKPHDGHIQVSGTGSKGTLHYLVLGDGQAVAGGRYAAPWSHEDTDYVATFGGHASYEVILTAETPIVAPFFFTAICDP